MKNNTVLWVNPSFSDPRPSLVCWLLIELLNIDMSWPSRRARPKGTVNCPRLSSRQETFLLFSSLDHHWITMGDSNMPGMAPKAGEVLGFVLIRDPETARSARFYFFHGVHGELIYDPPRGSTRSMLQADRLLFWQRPHDWSKSRKLIDGPNGWRGCTDSQTIVCSEKQTLTDVKKTCLAGRQTWCCDVVTSMVGWFWRGTDSESVDHQFIISSQAYPSAVSSQLRNGRCRLVGMAAPDTARPDGGLWVVRRTPKKEMEMKR